MSAKHLEPGRKTSYYIESCLVVLLAAVMIGAGCYVALNSKTLFPSSGTSLCLRGAATPVDAVEDTLNAAARDDWAAACKTVGADADVVESALDGVLMIGAPTVSSVQSTKQDWRLVDVEVSIQGLDGTNVMSLWTKPVDTPSGGRAWVVSLNGE